MYEHSGKLNAHVCNRVMSAWSETAYGMHARRNYAPVHPVL